MTEAQIKSVALFFFFTLLDEDLAERAARLTIENFRVQIKKKSKNGTKGLATDPVVVLIRESRLVFEKISKSENLNRAAINQKAKFLLPPGVSYGAWRQFHKEAPREDLIAIIWSRIVGFDDVKVAQGLGASEGTIRYRVGRGLRQLGHLLTLGEFIA